MISNHLDLVLLVGLYTTKFAVKMEHVSAVILIETTARLSCHDTALALAHRYTGLTLISISNSHAEIAPWGACSPSLFELVVGYNSVCGTSTIQNPS